MRSHPFGTSLVEMIVVLVLLSMFSALASELFMTIFKLNREVESSQTQVLQWSGTVELLQNDVWGATALKVDSDGALNIGHGDQTKTWRIEGATFTIDGAMVAMNSDRPKARGGGSYSFVSQVLLAGDKP